MIRNEGCHQIHIQTSIKTAKKKKKKNNDKKRNKTPGTQRNANQVIIDILTGTAQRTILT